MMFETIDQHKGISMERKNSLLLAAQIKPSLYAQITALEQFNGNTILDKWVRASGSTNAVTYSAPQEAFIHQAYAALVVQTRLRCKHLIRRNLRIRTNRSPFEICTNSYRKNSNLGKMQPIACIPNV
jgi:hypothetical protein